MKKHLIIGVVIGIVLAAATYMLLTNSHADFFSASSTVSATADPDYCQGDTPKEMISLMYLDDYDQCFEYSLDAVGYITAFIVVFLIPMVLGLLIGRLFRKK
ncbi:hypothetical protein [Parvicella tangerina]|uniref:Uncharacterized protein n=1 Tax=Parvicella tangerina TaxID=2829795 RepID=A0A916JJ06_9FLAO|nr:hypothetical protein [Parvicella tangerina]CAG5076377.1 hypothetical protein CRYO30217_00090 [Parvicella tangerina]